MQAVEQSSLHTATEESGSEDVHQPVGNCIKSWGRLLLHSHDSMEYTDPSFLILSRRTQAKRGRVLVTSKAVNSRQQTIKVRESEREMEAQVEMSKGTMY